MRLRILLTLAMLAGLSTGGRAAEDAAPQSPSASLVLLGTAGGPVLRATRSQPASLLLVNGVGYLVDAGDSVSAEIVKSGHALPQIRAVFLTHQHQDHTAGLGALVAFNWSVVRQTPLLIFGPPGTEALVQRGLSYFSISEETFRRGAPSPREMKEVPKPTEISSGGKVYEDENIRVIAAENAHYHNACPENGCADLKSFSYRFELKLADKPLSVVFTGDTGPSENVVKLAEGADVLVSEIIDLPSTITFLRNNRRLPEATLQGMVAHMETEHLTAEEVGKLARAAGVKQVVLNHFVWGNHEKEPDVKRLTEGVGKIYGGLVTPGYDLQVLPLGK